MSVFLLRKALQMLGECKLMVRGNSMEPSIKSGDLVIIRAKPFGSIALGDVIAYQSGSSVVVHRVVHQSDTAVYTAGDANVLIDDQPITPHKYIGKVEQVQHQNEEIERPVPKYKRNCMSLANRAYMRSRNSQPITIWLPKHLVDHYTLNLKIRSHVRYKIFHDPPPELLSGSMRNSSVGVSPWGLYPEECMRELLPRISNIFFMANFGPAESGYFPATHLLATVRIELFQIPKTPQEAFSQVSDTFCYMLGLLEEA